MHSRLPEQASTTVDHTIARARLCRNRRLGMLITLILSRRGHGNAGNLVSGRGSNHILTSAHPAMRPHENGKTRLSSFSEAQRLCGLAQAGSDDVATIAALVEQA